MNLHVTQIACFTASVLLGGVAMADTGSGDVSKQLELPSGQVAVRPRKLTATFAPYAPLFVEQKDTPTASKTTSRLDTSPRLFQKQKD